MIFVAQAVALCDELDVVDYVLRRIDSIPLINKMMLLEKQNGDEFMTLRPAI